MAVVKSGCLHRQSTILRRWKRNWFDLYSDGRLVFYNDQQRRDMEDDIHMKIDCINIRSSAACQDLNPPEGKMRDCLLQIVCRDGQVISLCADSADDALAWTVAFQDAWINMVYTAAPPTQIVYSADGEFYAVTYPSQYQGGSMAPGAGVKDIIMREQQSDNGEDTATEQQSDNDEDTATEQQSNNSEDTTTEQQSNNSEDTTTEQKRGSGADMALGVLMGAATGLAIASLFSVL